VIILLNRRKLTLCISRKAAVLETKWQVFRSPPGYETRACSQSGRSGDPNVFFVKIAGIMPVLNHFFILSILKR